jgi:hypothetical protein
MVFTNLKQTVLRQDFPIKCFPASSDLCVVARTQQVFEPPKEEVCRLQKPVVVVLSTCAQIQVCHGGEVMVCSSTCNDYYGFTMSLEGAAQELERLHRKYQVEEDSTLRFTMTVEVETHVYGWINGKLVAIKDAVYADSQALQTYLDKDVNDRHVKDRPATFVATWPQPMTTMWVGKTALARPDVPALKQAIRTRLDTLGVEYLSVDTPAAELFEPSESECEHE